MSFSNKISIKEKRIIRYGIISWICLIIIIAIQSTGNNELPSDESRAENIMMDMLTIVSDYCNREGIFIDSIADPGKTGLIGPELTGIVTTLGDPEAKRTTIQPAFASLMVRLLKESGAEEGDTISLGCSGSFPGLLLASLAAARSMDLDCKTVISIGASSFGATRPEFNILDIYQLLYESGIIDSEPAGVSLGGEGDTGGGWDPGIKKIIINRIKESGYLFIDSQNLKTSVDQRDSLYGFTGGSGVKVFINAGGAMANIGTSTSILGMKPGIVRKHRIPGINRQGSIHRALKSGIPVIHLLNIKGLAQEYGLKWDPVMLAYY